ncbi:hypothetical protein [Ascidiimonas aurantiaca]|uniref:hypothetical protein n=1 Tax=Ascidiimonas aurantiaca TaxID=1685432 RepID=UPI0030EEBF75
MNRVGKFNIKNMKNLFLSLVFILGTVSSFAGNMQSLEEPHCVHVTLSCDVEYDICNFTGTTTQLINMVIGDNNDVCGTDINKL